MILGLTIILFIIIYKLTLSDYSLINKMICLMIFSIPLSYVNVFGGSYSLLPLSWFHIFTLLTLIIIIIKILKHNKLENINLLYFGIFIIILGFLLMIFSPNIVDAFKQYLNIVLFIMLVTFASVTSSFIKLKLNLISDMYILTTVISSLFTLIQSYLYNYQSIQFGFIDLMGASRVAFGFIFTDYSFFSLFLITGATLILFKTNKNFMDFIFLIIILAGALVTSARTGIISLMILFSIVVLINLLKLKIKGFFQLLIFTAFSLLAFYLLLKVRGNQLYNDSGRLSGYTDAYQIFLESPFTGIGLGVSSYLSITGKTIPHNLISQLLVQTGIIFTFLVMIFIFMIIFHSFKINNEFKYGLYIVLIGSMFIPDILNSRFIIIMSFLLYFTYKDEKNESTSFT